MTRWPSSRPPSRSFATEIRAMQKTEVREVEEPFEPGRRAPRPCPTSGTRSAASRSSAWRAWSEPTRSRPRERRLVARARHQPFLGRARDRPRQLPGPRPHAAAIHGIVRGSW
jgi:hypothetical protein